MSPMDDTALRVPLILSIELDAIINSYTGDARREIDVVCNEQGLSGGESQNESLVSGTSVVIRQDPRNRT